MGKIINEQHLYAGGVETPDRKNEIIIILDCHDEEGYGVYTTDGFSASTSFTTSFGYGPMAEIMANAFFDATVNFHQSILKPYDESLDLEEKNKDVWNLIDDEWRDDWLKIVHEKEIDGTISTHKWEEDSDVEHLHKLLAFIAKWGKTE